MGTGDRRPESDTPAGAVEGLKRAALAIHEKRGGCVGVNLDGSTATVNIHAPRRCGIERRANVARGERAAQENTASCSAYRR